MVTMHSLAVLWGVLFSVFASTSSSRVLELSDKFVDFSNEGMWYVKFYAPWCGHCKKIEPVWAHVAQSLYNTPIKVAKVDCTRFTAVATHFKVRAYPTIMFIKDSNQFIYEGDRTRDEMVNYALRMSLPAVQKLSQEESISYLKDLHPVFFVYVGKQQGPLWDVFTYHAEMYQPHSWFYAMSHEVVSSEVTLPNETAVFVYKDEEAYFFEANQAMLEDKPALNETMVRWIKAERFGLFPRITHANLPHLLDTGKYLVMGVVHQNKLGEISTTERDFRDMLEDVIRKNKRSLGGHFQFGWTGSVELANGIAMSELSLPHLLVVNSSTNHHHLPDADPVMMTPEAVALFLKQIHEQQAPAYGGNAWHVTVYRVLWNARTQLGGMWRGNPVLTGLVFGLPLGFLSLICYSVCCADILDADEEDDRAETHEKKD